MGLPLVEHEDWSKTECSVVDQTPAWILYDQVLFIKFILIIHPCHINNTEIYCVNILLFFQPKPCTSASLNLCNNSCKRRDQNYNLNKFRSYLEHETKTNEARQFYGRSTGQFGECTFLCVFANNIKNIIESQSLKIDMEGGVLIFLLLFSKIVAQEGLAPLNNCLGNCAICKPDEPTTCSGQQFVQCVKGYEGPGCQIKDTYMDEFVLFHSGTQQANKAEWQLTGTAKCSYKNSQKQQKTVSVLGMYSQFEYNVVSRAVQSFYKNFIFTFSLIRTSWTPYSDLLRLAVLDQQQEIIHEYFIEYQQRDEINPKKNLLSCQNQLMIIEKFQIEAKIDPTRTKHISIRFEGMMFSEAKWSVTDVKLAFGCSKFLNYDETYQKCKGCIQGFKQITDSQKCVPCDVSCSSCSQQACTGCHSGFSLSNGKCTSTYKQSTFNIPSANLNCPSIGLLASSSQAQIAQQLHIPISLPISHNHKLIKFRISFQLYVQLNDNLSGDEQDYILVYLNNIQQSQLTQTQIYDNKNSNSRTKCNISGKSVNFILLNIHSNYVDATELNNQNKQAQLKVQRSEKFKFALSSVLIQYQEKQEPKQEPKHNESAKEEPKKEEQPKKQEPKKPELSQQQPLKTEPSKQQPVHQQPAKQETAKQTPVKEQKHPKPQSQQTNTKQPSNEEKPETKEQENTTTPQPKQPQDQKNDHQPQTMSPNSNDNEKQNVQNEKKTPQTNPSQQDAKPQQQKQQTDEQPNKNANQQAPKQQSGLRTLEPSQQPKPQEQHNNIEQPKNNKNDPAIQQNPNLQKQNVNEKLPQQNALSPTMHQNKQPVPEQNKIKGEVKQPREAQTIASSQPKQKPSEPPSQIHPPNTNPVMQDQSKKGEQSLLSPYSLPSPSSSVSPQSQAASPTTPSAPSLPPSSQSTSSFPQPQPHKPSSSLHDPIADDNTHPPTTNATSTTDSINQHHPPPSSPSTPAASSTPAEPSTPAKPAVQPTLPSSLPTLNTSAVSTAISQSIQKLQAHKNNIEFTLQPSSNLVVSLVSPIEFEHFPYFTVYLHNSNRTIVPDIVDVSKTKQLLKLSNNEHSLLDESIQIFMVDEQQHEELQRNKHHRERLNSNRVRLLQLKENRSLGVVHIVRYDQLPESHWDTLAQFSNFFTVISWVTIVSTIILTFLGISVITQQLSLLLQVIFLHVYIYTEYLPASFKGVVGGLWRIENLNYFTKDVMQQIQKFLLGNVIQQSPTTFRQYHLDINFTRAVYPCMIILIVYLVWFILVRLIVLFKIGGLPSEKPEITKLDRLKILAIEFSERTLNFWTQVWQYMFVVFVWAALLQLYNINYPSNSDRSCIPNAIFCIFCLVLYLAAPIATFIRTQKQYFDLDYFKYSHHYSHIFYQQLSESELPSSQHRIHVLIRCFRLVLLCLCFSYLCRYPVQALVIVLVSHVGYLVYKVFARIQRKLPIKIIDVIEIGLLSLLATLEMIAYGVSSWMGTPNYIALGYAMSVVSLLAVVNGLVRVGFYVYYMVSNKPSEHPSMQVKNEDEGSP